MRVLVLGAGIVGTTTAYYLVRDGHEVTLVDRQPGVAMECSHANGGYVAISQAVPWSTPGVPLKTMLAMASPEAPILLHAGELPLIWRWGLEFVRCSRAGVSWENTRHVLRLALYSFEALKEIREHTGVAYEPVRKGCLKVYSDQRSLDEAATTSQAQCALGLRYRVLQRDAILALVPGLGPVIDTLSGALFYPDEENGDCYAFTRGLAEWCRQAGMRLRLGCPVRGLACDGERIDAVVTDGERLTADAYVLAAGAETPRLMRPLGVRIPIIPVKGYSLTVPRAPWPEAPDMPVLDELRKFGFAPLGPDRLRLTGFAEIAGYDTTPRPRRSRAFVEAFTSLFTRLRDCLDAASVEPFCCLRPVTPSGLPILGNSRYRNFVYNVG